MQPEWTIRYDDNQMAHVLSDGTRKAWFAVREFMMENATCRHFLPLNPFHLHEMISLGLRPYKTEGGFEGFGSIADTKAITYAA